MPDTIQQQITFNTSAERLFEILLDSDLFSQATGAKAAIEPVARGHFSCFDDMITGRTIEAIPAQRIVQAWRVFNWEPGVYSLVTFTFEQAGENETLLRFEHKGFPEEHRDHLEKGWHSKYWEPMKAFVSSPEA